MRTLDIPRSRQARRTLLWISFFFFSSRRRHTRFKCDWSSDVCSSDLWIWGDRLIDGKTTGIGEWEGSYNNTHRAVDMIPEDVMICDWHYERPDQTPVYFALKGLSVVTCPWRMPENAVKQAQDMV